MAAAIAGPGVDTRTWVSDARVDDDDDAIRWDTERGWIVDVTLLGGGLDQEGPFGARLAVGWAGDGYGEFDPPTRGMLVSVLVCEGNPNTVVWITGRINTTDLPVPTQVNGQDIDEDFAKAHHITVSPHGLQQQFGKEVRIEAKDRATFAGSEVRLQTENADQPYVRGTTYADALGTFLDALLVVFVAIGTFATAVGAALPPLVVPAQTLNTAISTQFQAALQQFKNARQQYLSTKIKGE